MNVGVPQSADVLDSFVDVIGSQLRMSVLAANGNVSSDVQASIDQTLKYVSKHELPRFTWVRLLCKRKPS